MSLQTSPPKACPKPTVPPSNGNPVSQLSPVPTVYGSTVVGEYLKASNAPILAKALGTQNSMHAEDGSWEQLELKGKPGPKNPANPAKYRPGTFTIVIGYTKMISRLSIKTRDMSLSLMLIPVFYRSVRKT
ncbi:hypothetical protein OIDMADRAFT_35912 [Oidiodendron maius Zn]|uniref:Uncharacterized protein n=1 Tax=Oidiodendron maius (strain Zn) TaxID=913774 RepID=A0A0C3GAN5_OIDMZ|nr:hypothetical protein OIDMADRAFT_35912 [Oidiodendron maius Zn]